MKNIPQKYMVLVEFTFPQISDFREGGEFYAQPHTLHPRVSYNYQGETVVYSELFTNNCDP